MIKIENIDKKHERVLIEILELVEKKVDLKSDERSAIKTVLNATDWAQRIIFWQTCLKILTPFTKIAISKLLGF